MTGVPPSTDMEVTKVSRIMSVVLVGLISEFRLLLYLFNFWLLLCLLLVIIFLFVVLLQSCDVITAAIVIGGRIVLYFLKRDILQLIVFWDDFFYLCFNFVGGGNFF